MTKLKDAAEDFLAQMTSACGTKPASPPSTPAAPVVTVGGKAYDYDSFMSMYADAYADSAPFTSPAGSTVPQTTHKPTTSYQAHAGLIQVQLDATTFDGPWKVGNSFRDWWNEAVKHYPPTDGTIIIPRDRVGFTYGQVKFNACVFTATEDYLKARHGRTLHTTDRDWLAQHQLATDDGVPQEYMALCIHAMLEPYGMGISGMRVRKGLLAIGESMQTFMDALGVNPFAMVDRQTSNKEAAEKLGMSLEDANKMWRFEFTDEPLPGCTIIAEKGWSSGNGVQTGYQGGHARYLAPRAKAGNWAVSLQLDTLDRIDYYVAPVVPEYKPRKGEATLDLGAVQQPDGKALVAVMFRNTYYSPEVAAQKKADADKPYTAPKDDEKEQVISITVENGRRKIVTKKGYVTTTRYEDIAAPSSAGGQNKAGFTSAAELLTQHSKAADTTSNDAAQISLNDAPASCSMCKTETTWGDCCDGTDICLTCWDGVWENYRCPHKGCEVRFNLSFTPWFVARDAELGETRFECPNRKCRGEIVVNDTDAQPRLAPLVELATYCPDMSAEEFSELRDEYLSQEEEEEWEDPAVSELAKAYGADEDDDQGILGFDRNAFQPKG